MPSIIDSFVNIISGIWQAIMGALGSVVAIIQSGLHIFLGLLGAIFDTISSAVVGVFHAFEGVFQFLLGNILVIGAVVAAFFLYTVYQKRNAAGQTKKTS